MTGKWPSQLILTPKKHAEWTFRPNLVRSRAPSDVGIFIDNGEVLVLSVLSEPLRENGKMQIPIAIGTVEIFEDQWMDWNFSLNEATSCFDEDRILGEYVSEP